MAARNERKAAIIGAVGVEGWHPFLIVALAVALSIVPLGFANGLAPRMPELPEAPLSDILRAQPLVMIVAICGGLMDFALYALLPVYGLRHGLDQRSAVLMLSVFTGGNVLLQIPIGWIADHTSRPAVLIVCILSSLAGALFLPFAIATPALLYSLMFLWGGALFAIYTVGLGLLGDGFPRAQLAAANVVFVMVYQIGGASGPILAGTAIDVIGSEGLVVVVAIAATVLTLAFVKFRRR
jgi:MFS family permease